MDLIKILPEEVWDKVFDYLNKSEFLELFAVSRELYEHLGYSRYFRRRFYFQIIGDWFDESDQDMTAVLKMKRLFSKIMLSNPRPHMKKILLARRDFENITEFEFSCPFDVKSPDILFYLNLYRDSIEKLTMNFFGSCFIDDRLIGDFNKLQHIESDTTSLGSIHAVARRARKLESVKFMNKKTHVFYSKD